MLSDADELRVSPPEFSSDPVVLHLPGEITETPEPSGLLQVFVGASDPCCEGRTPIAGRYARDGNTLALSPAFAFEPGRDYGLRRSRHDADGRRSFGSVSICHLGANAGHCGDGDLPERRCPAQKTCCAMRRVTRMTPLS